MTREEEIQAVKDAYGPCLEKPLLIGDKVRIKPFNVNGEITGISLMHVIRTYIVTVSEDDAFKLKGFETPATTVIIGGEDLELLSYREN